MIKGIGIDLTELDRIKRLHKRQPRFYRRVLSLKEQETFKSYRNDRRKIEFLAGRFAAKEAYSKATGTGIGKDISFQSLEVISNQSGQPCIWVNGEQDPSVFVSISHSRHYVVAQVIIEQV
ncbi:holo-ACP synthase [Alkalibacillus aidingensis]|uniref:holo-ACP synthase n=1 Tax=Alkalibacillus aidingensis TaxID=2747607 RepID=UPI00166070A2|nr:holo-ACP synthase [Alkalibacillus aidingensis]